ncbi:MAG TPA: glycosyltransferase [Opitutaceae bacterium]|jgi:glycosyltransferase involved in cell wall biosynthesis|nr:glycosyltransferase [Opitutaceae bacterium]
MPLKILHVSRTAEADAQRSAESVLRLASGQRELGHHVEVITFSQDGLAELEASGTMVHRLPRGLGSYGLSRTFVRWLRVHASRYDCVVVHGIWSFSALGTWWALRDSTTPFFIFTHGNLEPWFKLHRPLRHMASWLYWPWGVYPALRDAHSVFFVCDNERQRARETFWLYDCHEFVVRTGVPEIPLKPTFSGPFLAKHPGLRGRRLFLHIADHEPRHGIRALLGALDSLARVGSWDKASMTLVIAGTPPAATRDAAMRSERLGLGQSVFCAGPLSDDERHDALGLSEAMLRPSSSEISANRVAESLSVGTPVLLSKGVSIWKDVVNSGAGLADDEDAEGLAKLLGRWLALPDAERESMRELARRCYEERFSMEGAAQSFTSAIYLLIGVHRDGRWDGKPLKPASELP